MSKLPGHALIVDIPCASPEKAKQFKTFFEPLVRHSFENERGTLTYHWSLPVNGDEKTYKGLELYESRSALEDLHLKSPHFAAFGAQIQEHAILAPGANLILEHVTPVAGFLVRPDAPNNGNSPPGAFIWSGKFVTQPGQADAVIAALKTNIPYIEAQEPGTISFLVLKGEGEQTVYVWERYVDERSLREVHHVSEGYLRMRERLGPLILERSISGYYEVMGFLTKEGGVIQQQ